MGTNRANILEGTTKNRGGLVQIYVPVYNLPKTRKEFQLCPSHSACFIQFVWPLRRSITSHLSQQIQWTSALGASVASFLRTSSMSISNGSVHTRLVAFQEPPRAFILSLMLNVFPLMTIMSVSRIILIADILLVGGGTKKSGVELVQFLYCSLSEIRDFLVLTHSYPFNTDPKKSDLV